MNRQVRDNTLVASESTAQMRLTIRLRLMRRVALVLLLLCAATVRAADSLTVAVSIAPATMIANGATSDITPMSVRTAWNTPGTKNYTVTSCIYMTGALTPAIAANTDSIPYTDVRATSTVIGTTAMVNQSSCNAAGALVIGSSVITDRNSADPNTRSKNGYRDDAVTLHIVNVGSLAPDTYTGTIFVSALTY